MLELQPCAGQSDNLERFPWSSQATERRVGKKGNLDPNLVDPDFLRAR
jgi:hypothetical protein